MAFLDYGHVFGYISFCHFSIFTSAVCATVWGEPELLHEYDFDIIAKNRKLKISEQPFFCRLVDLLSGPLLCI